MAIKFNVVEKPQPGVTGGGVKKWYASAKVDGEISVDELTKEIEKFSALSEADIRGGYYCFRKRNCESNCKWKNRTFRQVRKFLPESF